MALRPATTKSWRSLNALFMSVTQVWSPLSATVAARCEMLEAFDVDWPCMVAIAATSSLGPRSSRFAIRHRVRLRHAVDGDRAAIELRIRLGKARERLGRPVDVFVHFIGSDDDLRVLVEYGAQRLQLGARVGAPVGLLGCSETAAWCAA